MTTPNASPADDRTGIAAAGVAYVFWGIMPLYWRLLDGVPPMEMTVHRIFWCALFVTAVILARGHLPRVLTAVRSPRVLGTLALTSVLITTNWTIYIYCVATNQLVEGSLGYYMTPLISFALGFVFFGENISRFRMAAIALAAVAVVIQVAALGHVPWIAPSLAISFGLYGYLRKKAPVAALDGLMIETVLLFPFTLGLVVYWGVTGQGAFSAADLARDALLIGAGPLTALPLALFAAGARRIRMTTLGFLQYLAPSISLVVAIFVLHEGFTNVDLLAFGCVWAALVIVALEGRRFGFPARTASTPVGTPVVTPMDKPGNA